MFNLSPRTDPLNKSLCNHFLLAFNLQEKLLRLSAQSRTRFSQKYVILDIRQSACRQYMMCHDHHITFNKASCIEKLRSINLGQYGDNLSLAYPSPSCISNGSDHTIIALFLVGTIINYWLQVKGPVTPTKVTSMYFCLVVQDTHLTLPL